MKKLNGAVIAIFLVFYILPLGVRPLIIPDEPRYAEIPREMISSGDWIVPRLNGLRYFEKPVLGYWLTALSIKMFGENAFAVRFPSAMATGLSALMIFFLVQRFVKGGTPAVYAAVIFLTCLEVYGIGTYNVLDSMLAVFVTGAMTSFFYAYTAAPSTRRRQGFLLLFGLFCGLAFLTKGFLAFAIPVLVIVPFMIWEGRWKEIFVIPRLPIAAAFLVAIPWGIMIHLREPDFWHFFVWNEHIKRFLSDSAQHHESFWYFFLAFPAAALPWAFLTPASIFGLKKTGIKTSIVRYCLFWFLLPFLFFSISKGKLLTYILPCFPPLAILVAIGLTKYFETGGRKAFDIGGKFLALLTAGIAVALIFIQMVGFKGFKPYAQTWKWLLGAVGFATFSFFLLKACRETEYKKKMLCYAVSPILVFFSAHFLVPDLTLQHKAPGDFLLRHSHRIKADTILVADEDPMGAVCWYYKRNNVYFLEGAGEMLYGLSYEDAKYRSLNLEQFRDLILKNIGTGRVVLVEKSEKYEQWKKSLPKPLFEDTNGKGGFVFVQY